MGRPHRLHRNLDEILHQGDIRDNDTSDRNNRDNLFDEVRCSAKNQKIPLGL